MKTAKDIVTVIEARSSGLIQFSAKLSLDQDRPGTFLKHLHDQLTEFDEHNPNATRERLGEEISEAILFFFRVTDDNQEAGNYESNS